MLVNPAGIVFGQGSQVNTGGLVASTLGISDANFSAGKYSFANDGAAGSIVNQGRIVTPYGGVVALIAPVVQNQGSIETPKGSTLLAAADKVSIDFKGDGLITYSLDAGTANALVENSGSISADGGLAVLTAKAADAVSNAVVNNSGVVQAKAMNNVGGRIVLEGGSIEQSGTVQAGQRIDLNVTQLLINTGSLQAGDGATGGQINANVKNLVDAGSWDVSGSASAGNIAITASGTAEQTHAGNMKAVGPMGGNVHLAAGTSAYLSGAIDASGTLGAGGDIAITAPDLTLAGATLHADGSGTNANGGRIRTGGGWQGSDADLANATTSLVDSATTLSANAGQGVHDSGNGGSVVLWSNSHTAFAGSIEAKGGTAGGDGGQVEVSSHDTLAFVGQVVTAAPHGANGSLLLDPKNINIETTVSNGFTATTLDAGTTAAANRYLGSSGVTELVNGNLVVSSQQDPTGGTNAGAVRLYSPTGTLISTLTGSNASGGADLVGGGITALPNGNFVVTSPYWGRTSTGYGKGAVTWVDGAAGLTGTVSATNSLVGSNANGAAANSYGDQVGSGRQNGGAIMLLTGSSNFIVFSGQWGGNATSQGMGSGAVTWMNGSNGHLADWTSGTIGGVVSASNSYLGASVADMANAVPTVLANGNYVLSNPYWNFNKGFVAWGNGAAGLVGTLSGSNAFQGKASGDQVQLGAALTDGNYVVASPGWGQNAGFASWVNGSTGKLSDGSVNPSFSRGVAPTNSTLLGSSDGVSVGWHTGSSVVALPNGRYVVFSSGDTTYQGHATWADAGGVTFGFVDNSNSLYSVHPTDFVNGGVTVLSNGNYVVYAPQWWSGSTSYVGSATWVDGSNGHPMGETGVSAVVSSSNSLVGATGNDRVGYGGVVALSNGNYVVKSPNWSVVGAATWGDGAAGTAGTVSASNSLVGSHSNDQVGYTVVALTNGNYVVGSYNWANGATTAAGAATWGDGSTAGTRLVGAVSASNSVVGSSSSDNVGQNIVALTNGNYVVSSSFWHAGANAYAGALTWANGSNGHLADGSLGGAISSANSLVGSSAYDQVGAVAFALPNGNYVSYEGNWASNTGAVTWGNGASGTVGVVSSANSLVGATTSDRVGSPGAFDWNYLKLTSDGNVLIRSPNAGLTGLANVGAMTWMDSSNGHLMDGNLGGVISATNSYFGATANEQFGNVKALTVGANAGGFIVYSPNATVSSLAYAGQVYLYKPSGAPALTGDLLYTANAGADNTLAVAQITNLLNAGTNLTLQASNDLTINGALAANNPSGNGGTLSLSAGRSVLINASISTDNGNLNLLANDTLAHGVVDADRAAGAAVITMASGTSINAGTGQVNITLANGAGKTNSTSGEITLRGITAGSISAVNSGGTGGVTLASGALTASGTGKAIVLSGQSFTNSAGASAMSATNGNWLVYSASPGATTKGGETSSFRHYGATYGSYAPGSVTETGNGFIYASAAGALSVATTLASGTASSIYGDTPTATFGTTFTGFADSEDNASNIGLAGTATFNNLPTAASHAGTTTVGYNTGLTDTAGYTFTSGTGLSYTVNQRTVTLSGSKTYDGSTSLTGAVTLGNTVGSETLAYSGATVNDKNVATASKYINAITLANGTGLASDYQLPTLNVANAPVTISAKALTESGLSVAASKVYDATTGVTLIGTAALQGTEAAGAGSTADGKPYSGDTVSLTGTAVGTYNSKDVASATTVTYSGLSLTGAQAGNYTLTTQGTSAATITTKALTESGLSVAASKVYDASTGVTLIGTATLQAQEAAGAGTTSDGKPYTGDTVSLTGTAVGTYNSKDVATATTVTYSGLSLTGAQVGNYTLTTQGTSAATITTKALTESGLSVAASKVYDATTGATVLGTAALQAAEAVGTGTTADGVPYSGDTVNLSGTAVGTYNSKNVATATIVTYSGMSLSGAQASNYSLTTQGSSSATITTKALTESGLSVAASKVYDATTGVTLIGSAALPTAEAAGAGTTSDGKPYTGDTVNLNGTAVGTYNSKDVATATTVTYSGISLSGAQAANYTLTTQGTSAATITAKALTENGLSVASSKVYDATTGVTLIGTAALPAAEAAGAGSTADGKPYSGDTVNLTGTPVGTYNSKDVATATTVAYSGMSLTGTQAGNYTLTTQASSAATISAKPLTESGLSVASSKTYDATTGATVLGTAALQTAEAVGAGSSADGVPYSGDVVNLSGTPVGTYNSKNVATANTVAYSGMSLSGAQAGNYSLTTQANSSATIAAKALTESGLSVAASKVYDGNTNVTLIGTAALPSAEAAGAGTTSDGKPYSGDTVSLNGTAVGTYNSKDVLAASTVTYSGLSLAGGQAGNYTLTTQGSSAASITPKTVGVSATKTYDASTDLTGFVTLTTSVGSETLTYTGATASDAHVATASKYINAITLANASDSSGGLASNYQLPTLDAAHAPVTINAKTLTETLTNTGVTKVYDGNTDAPSGFTPSWGFSGFVAGDTDAALSSTGVVYNSKNVVGATTITKSGLVITGITGSHSSAASDYQLATSSASANAAITPKTVTVSATKTYDGSTSLTGAVTLGTGVGSETLAYSGASANDRNVVTAGKYVNAITLANATDGSGGISSNYQLPTLDAANAPVTINTKALTESGLSVAASKVYDATINVTLLGSAALQTTEAAGAGSTADGKPYSVDAVSLSGTPVGTYNSKDVLAANTVAYSGLSLAGAGASNYTLTVQGNSAATITPKPLTESGLSVAASRVYNGTTTATVLGTATLQTVETAGAGTTSDGKPYTGDVVNLSGTPVGTYDHKDVATASTVSYTGLSLAGAQVGNYTLTVQSPSAATITPQTVTVSATKTYDGSASLTGAVSIGTGVGSETLTYSGAAASDAHVATAGKYVNAITLGNASDGSGGLSNNYQLPTLDAVNAPVTINAKTLTETLSNTGVTKVYDGGTSAPVGFTPTWSFSGFVAGDTDAALSSTGVVYNNKNVVGATTITESGLAITGITGSHSSAASDYQLATSSAGANAAITAKTVTVSASKTYDGSTSLVGAVSIGTGVGSETLGYSGATANDAHVATSGKYVNAITLADATDSSGGLASNYQLPTLNAANASVSISTRTLTETLTNTGVTKVYDGNTDVPTGFTPAWNVTGFAAGDSAATLSSGAASYNSKDVVSATAVTVSGVAITGISGGNASASSDYQLATASPSVAAAITPKGISLAGNKTYDSSTDLTGKVTLGNLVGSETLAYSGATANDKNVITAGKYVNAITLENATDGSGGLASNYQLPSLATASADNQVGIAAKNVSLAGSSGVTKTYDGTVGMPVGNTGRGDVQGLVMGDAVTLAGVPVFDSANAGARAVQQGSLALTGGDASNYTLVWSDGSGTIHKAPLVVSANADAKFVTQSDAAGYNGVSYSGFVHGETTAVLGGSVTITRAGGDTLAGTYNGVLVPTGLTAGNYAISYTNGNYTIVPADQLLVKVQNTSTTYGTGAAYNIISAQYLDGSNVIHTLSAPTVSGNTYTYSDGAGGTAQFTLGALAPQASSAGQLVAGNYAVGANNVAETSVNFSNNLVVVGNLGVNQKSLTASATNVSKVYDGNTSMANVSLGLTGLETGDAVTVSGVGAFSQKNVGTQLSYTVAVQGLSGTDAANYYLSQGNQFSGTDGAITPKTVSISAGRVYDGSTTLGAGTVTITTGVGSETLSYSGAAANTKNVGGGNFVSAITLGNAIDGSGGLTGNYQVPSMTSAGADNAVTITPKTMTVSGITATNKVYDGSAVAAVSTTGVSEAGLVSGDVVNVSATGLFNNKNVANGKTVTLSSNYSGADVGNYTITDQASTTADVTPKALTVSGITAANKVYDGNAVAAVSMTGVSEAGLVAGDVVNVSATGLFNDKNVANGKTVTLSSSYGGADVGNYSITNQASTSADVTPKALTVSGIIAGNKVYDGNAVASVSTAGVTANVLQAGGMVAGDDIIVAASGSFNDKNVGTGKTVTLVSTHSGADVGNYTITNQASTTADVTPKALTVSGITAANKVYDGNAVAAVSTTGVSEAGLVSGDVVNVSATGQFNDKNVANGKTVTLSSSYGGADVGNYTITNQVTTTADVTPKALTVSGITAANKVYDGNAVATVSTAGVSESGLVTGDIVNVSATGQFDSKNAGTGKTVTLTSNYSGADVGNYSITGQASTTADISPKTISVSGTTAADKLYDGNTTASLTLGTLSGLVGTETLTVSGVGNFDTANPGTGKTVTAVHTVSDGSNGGLASNYLLAVATTTTKADITSTTVVPTPPSTPTTPTTPTDPTGTPTTPTDPTGTPTTPTDPTGTPTPPTDPTGTPTTPTDPTGTPTPPTDPTGTPTTPTDPTGTPTPPTDPNGTPTPPTDPTGTPTPPTNSVYRTPQRCLPMARQLAGVR